MNILYWIKNVGIFENGDILVKGSATLYKDDIDFVIKKKYCDDALNIIKKDNVKWLTHYKLIYGKTNLCSIGTNCGVELYDTLYPYKEYRV